jgi:competence ComEA-like helix-hairpin-helix protein
MLLTTHTRPSTTHSHVNAHTHFIGRPSFRRQLRALIIGLMVMLCPVIAFADLVNINTANQETLQSIPGIGAKKAADIVKYREKNGRFKRIDELVNVTGIGEKTLDKILPYITLKGGVSSLSQAIHPTIEPVIDQALILAGDPPQTSSLAYTTIILT